MPTKHNVMTGDVVEFTYHGKERRGRVERVYVKHVVIDVFGEGYKSFRYEKMVGFRTLHMA